MAEPDSRAGRNSRIGRRPARVLLLVSAMIVIVLSGLFLARSASAATAATAATTASAAQAATTEHAASADHAAAAEQAAAGRTDLGADTGICNVPGIGDIGGIVGLCAAGSGVVSDLNNICTSGAPTPELASTGIDSLITTPGGTTSNTTLYDNYGMAGQFWASSGLTCSQAASSIGNNVAGMVFDIAKSLDRVTITVYQSAASANILSWLSSAVDRLITALGSAVYYPYLSVVVIIGAIWLAWQGLVRKRATRTFEGTIWMVVAVTAAVWLIGRPGDFTNIGTNVSNGVTSVLNAAFAKLPATTGSDCLPVTSTDPQSVTANYSFDSGNGMVDQNANELWTVLVCKPWLDGELGTTQYAAPGSKAAQTNVLNLYGRQLLWSQAIAANEQPVTADLYTAKEATYNGIAADLKANNPGAYSLFQGDQWTTRLEIGFEALFAAVAAGLLILLIALTLIMLKLGFLLLLVAGPFFLLVGIQPGFGRVIAIRWFEMLVGVLLKQVAVALTLSVLLYCYSLIMGTTDQVLPWALKIMMIALVTVTVVIYRKPFQHLFSSVGYGMLGADERAQVSWRESALGFRRVTASAAGVVVPPAGAGRASRWVRGGSAESSAAAAADSGGGSGGAATAPGASGGPTADSHAAARQWPGAAPGGRGRAAPPLQLPPDSGTTVNTGPASAGWARGGGTSGGARGPGQPPARGSGQAPPRTPAPPAVRQGPAPAARPATGNGWPGAGSRPRSGSSDGATDGAGKPAAAPLWARTRRRSK